MHEKQPASRSEVAPLSLDDAAWLIDFTDGAELDERWFGQMNQLAEIGSKKNHKDYPEVVSREILTARSAFYNNFTQLAKPLEHIADSYPNPIKFINLVRLLHNEGVEITEAASRFPRILMLGEDNVREKINLLKAHEIDTAGVVNKFPRILSFSPITLPEKINALEKAGISVSRAVNSHPNILVLPVETIRARQELYTAAGLDFSKIINKNPRLLTFAPYKVNERLRVLYAIAKSWGVDDYRLWVNEFIEQWPTILTYKATKLRVLGRIASHTISPMTAEEITLSNVTNTVKSNIEAVLAAYLTDSSEIKRPQDIYRLNAKYKTVGSQMLKETIAANKEDPIVKVYLRGYSL